MTACLITRPDPQTLWNLLANEFSARVMGGAPIVPETPEFYVVNSDFLAAELYYSISEQALRETQPATMCDDNFTAYYAKLGIYPKPASFARGYVQITGTATTAIPPSLQVTFGASTYSIDPLSTPPTVIGADGTALLTMQSTIPGAASNATGVTGNIVSPPTGINATATSYGAMFCNGAPAETIAAFRTRALARQATVPNDDWNWLASKIMEWPCVTRVCPRTSGCCNRGRIEAYVFFDNSFTNGVAPQCIIDDISHWVFGANNGSGNGQARIGMFGKLFTATPLPINVSVGNLNTVTSAQWALISSQIASLFNNRCPGETICSKWVDAIIVSVVSNACNFTVQVNAQDGTVVSCGGNVVAPIDRLPVLGTITRF